MDERLDTLETAVAFQEAKIEELTAAVDAQQMQLQTLERVVEELVERLKSMSHDEPPPANVKPPHY